MDLLWTLAGIEGVLLYLRAQKRLTGVVSNRLYMVAHEIGFQGYHTRTRWPSERCREIQSSIMSVGRETDEYEWISGLSQGALMYEVWLEDMEAM